MSTNSKLWNGHTALIRPMLAVYRVELDLTTDDPLAVKITVLLLLPLDGLSTDHRWWPGAEIRILFDMLRKLLWLTNYYSWIWTGNSRMADSGPRTDLAGIFQ